MAFSFRKDAVKAITITKENQSMLGQRFDVEPLDYPEALPIGYILVTDFGNDETFEVLTAQKFGITFTITNDLDNGFVAIV